MTTETEALKREIEGLSPHPQTRRYSPGLQGRVTAWAKKRGAGGISIPGMCHEVGIGEPTLRRFLEEVDGPRRPKRKARNFKRVKVVAPEPHGRRYFVAAEASDAVRSKQFLDMAAELFAIEAQAPPGPEGDDLRRRLRNEKSRPVVARIKEWLIGQRFLPGSSIGAAIKYIAGHWEGLTVFLEEPAVPISNNQTERGYCGPAIGRRNHYGSHSKQGTKVAAILYTLIETAKLNGIAPKRYLKMALAAALAGERIPLPFELKPEN